MKRITGILAAFAVALFFCAPPVFAQRGGSGHAGGGMGGGAGTGMGESQGRGSSMGRGSDMGRMGGTSTGSISGKSATSLLSSNTHLASTLQTRLGSLLPAGMSLTDAASGFKNLGQFIAALHVSKNLDIPFTDLKAKMMSGDSLGKAIASFKPGTSTKAEVHKANRQADEDLKEASKAAETSETHS